MTLVPPPATHGAGLILAALGIVAAIVRGTVLPALPRLLPVILIVTALGVIAVGIVRRLRWHLRAARERR